MIWIILLIGAALWAWFLFAPRRVLENTPAVVDEEFEPHHIIETTEDPREVAPIAQKAAHAAGDRPVKGHGDSLTRDWPNEKREPHEQKEH